MPFLNDVVIPNTSSSTITSPKGSFLKNVILSPTQTPVVPPRAPLKTPLVTPQLNSMNQSTPVATTQPGLNPVSLIKNFGTNLWSTYEQTPSKITDVIKTGVSDLVKDGILSTQANPIGLNIPSAAGQKDLAKIVLGTTGNSVAAIFAPISAAIGSILQQSGGQAITDSTGKVIANGSGISDLPAFQKFALSHPNAGSYFNDLLNLVMSSGETDTIDPARMVQDTKNFANDIVSAAPKTIPIQSIGEENNIPITKPQVTGGFLDNVIKPNNSVQPDMSQALEQKNADISPTLKTQQLPIPPDIAPGPEPTVNSSSQQSTIIPKELQPLAEEAQKYANVDDFVNYYSQNIDQIPSSPEYKQYLSEQDTFIKKENDIYAQMKSMRDQYAGKTINDVPASDITKYENLQKELSQTLSKKTLAKIPEGVIKTHIGEKGLQSQLTDFYNNVNSREQINIPLAKEIPQSEKTLEQPVKIMSRTTQSLKPIEGTGYTKARGLSEGVEAKAIENKLTDNFGDLPEYKTVSMADQAKQASDIISKDAELAKSIAMGEKAPPKGVLPESVFVAVENKAIAEGDVQTLKDLATSKLSASATTMGQRIRTLAERDPTSPVGAIQEVQAARSADIAKRGDIAKQTQDTINQIKESIKKVPTTKQTWNDFVDSITC